MATRISPRHILSLLVVILTAVVVALGLASTASAAPSVSGCGANKYVAGISTKAVAGPDYKIVLTPTSAARNAPANRDVTVSMWHQIQSCVPGLYGQLADSIWQQLECHQMIPIEKIGSREVTGPTYDLESWREALENPNPASYVNTHCLNENGLGAENGTPGYGNNFPGYSDLAEGTRHVG
ncbi:hypothetical protein P3H15_47445 [Rhodococcus sp. T2V]|uniref:hypothetical protein n=1 Tax=Rhodococcus sp. T2V TaxID=3034164 RepID=UPI0023E1E169|nr:hypothetical protein [Rhodococcus sp. T2V]MDF3312585.1 hypothetical protein [Rhodococcus sp. T2V]